MSRPCDASSELVLILAPTGRDGEMICERLRSAGVSCEVCVEPRDLFRGLTGGVGAAMLAEEALNQAGAEELLTVLDAQEPWSDVPLILLTLPASRRAPSAHRAVALFERANVILLERPTRPELLLSAVRSALRARRRQYQMRDLHRELEQAVQLREMFVSILSHDLRSPLAAIKMSAEMIVRSADVTRSLRSAGRILSSSDRMTRMIEQLLDFARVRRQGGIAVQPRTAHLEELVRPIMQELEDANPTTPIRLSAKGELSGTWDADRLGRVVANLAGNAVKHGTQGKLVLVELDGTDASTVRIRVSNFGAIPADLLPTLFEPFKRTGPAKTGERGLGLGLFIAREIVQAHSGMIDVRIMDDDVTVFEVSLPRDTIVRERSAAPEA